MTDERAAGHEGRGSDAVGLHSHTGDGILTNSAENPSPSRMRGRSSGRLGVNEVECVTRVPVSPPAPFAVGTEGSAIAVMDPAGTFQRLSSAPLFSAQSAHLQLQHLRDRPRNLIAPALRLWAKCFHPRIGERTKASYYFYLYGILTKFCLSTPTVPHTRIPFTHATPTRLRINPSHIIVSSKKPSGQGRSRSR